MSYNGKTGFVKQNTAQNQQIPSTRGRANSAGAVRSTSITPEQIENAVKHARWLLIWRAAHYDVYFSDPEVALMLCHFRESNREALIGLARSGWRTAQDLLGKMVSVLTSFGDPLPRWLQEHVAWAMTDGEVQRPKRRRGCDPLTNLVRNTVIAQATDMLARSHGLQPTRNAATALGESACSIVAKALATLGHHMSEANVTRIWREDRDTVKREREIRWRELEAKLRSLCSGMVSSFGGDVVAALLHEKIIDFEVELAAGAMSEVD
jgi:hypothetical protein